MDRTSPPPPAPLLRLATSAAPAIEELLAHASWARELARTLVADEQRADDVVQEAWLAAVEKPPAPGPGLRAWFTRLIRNVAHNQRRSELRRESHERRASTPEPSPWAHEGIAEEFAAQRLLADALLRVNEPYRETLLRRWYHDEKPAAIARAMAVPVKTVETRLARGLERLREELTKARGEGSNSPSFDWKGALLPLIDGSGAGGTALVGMTATAASPVAVLAMASSPFKFVAAAAVIVASLATWAGVQRVARSDSKGSVDVEAAGSGKAPVASAEARAFDREVAAQREAGVDDEDDIRDADPLAAWRKDGRLHGRVVSSETGLPVVGAAVAARVPRLLVSGNLGTATTDANGEFRFERLSDSIQLSIELAGYLPLDRELFRDELTSSPDASALAFQLEPRLYAALICRLEPEGSATLPDGARVTVLATASDSRKTLELNSDAASLRQPGASSQARSAPVANGVARFDAVPARYPLDLSVRVGDVKIVTARVEPLDPGSSKEIAIPIRSTCLVSIAFADAATGEPIAIPKDEWYSEVEWDWVAVDGAARVTKQAYAHDVGRISVPGAGRIDLRCDLRGFAPASIVADAREGATVTVPLTRWRPLEVKVRTRAGEPYWGRSLDENRPTPTTRFASGGGLPMNRRALELRIAVGNESLTPVVQDDRAGSNRALPISAKGKGRFGVDGFRVFAPREPIRIGLYCDGDLVAFRSIDERAETAELVADFPEDELGGLRLRVVDAAGRPVSRYCVEVARFVGRSTSRAIDHSTFDVVDGETGTFSWGQLLTGRYEVRVRRSSADDHHRWVGEAVVNVESETDLGVIEMPEPGALDVRVVDEASTSVIGATVSLFIRSSDVPIEFTHGGQRKRTARTDEHGRLRTIALRPLSLRIEATSGGSEHGETETEVESGETTAVTVVLPRLPAR